ncbi:hypothetical protein [Microcoleus sp. LEGE 07076]|uniref:hypothetical protein n=1 Tax=Microcoleus sp. LEGE 07076 TaxID=915322 RepID=UPI001D1403AA|nr:hypothetical protein [Microcoleus sp. LEGE 07076]
MRSPLHRRYRFALPDRQPGVGSDRNQYDKTFYTDDFREGIENVASFSTVFGPEISFFFYRQMRPKNAVNEFTIFFK